MTKENKFKIGLALNAIATLSDKETFDRIKGRLTEIETIILNEPTDDHVEKVNVAENTKKNGLLESIRAWNAEIEKRGYVN